MGVQGHVICLVRRREEASPRSGNAELGGHLSGPGGVSVSGSVSGSGQGNAGMADLLDLSDSVTAIHG